MAPVPIDYSICLKITIQDSLSPNEELKVVECLKNMLTEECDALAKCNPEKYYMSCFIDRTSLTTRFFISLGGPEIQANDFKTFMQILKGLREYFKTKICCICSGNFICRQVANKCGHNMQVDVVDNLFFN